MPETTTIDAVHDALAAQLAHGGSAVLSDRLLPSVRLWALVAATLTGDAPAPLERIVVSPTDSGSPVRLSPVLGDSCTLTGQVTLVGVTVTTTITISVTGGEPDLAFALSVPAGWSLGRSFAVFHNRFFDVWSSQLTGTVLAWQSAGTTAADALTLRSTLRYDGVYAVLALIYGQQDAEPFVAPIAFGPYGPALNARVGIDHAGTGALSVGPVEVVLPEFIARLTYQPDVDNETLMVPTSTTGLVWRLRSQNAAVADFEIAAQITDDYPVLTVGGNYPNDDDALALADIVAAIYGGEVAVPSLPGPLQFLATDVGLRRFSVSAGLALPPVFQAAEIEFGTKPDSAGWVIIGPASAPLLALQEIHFRYATIAADGAWLNEVGLGGTLRIGTLLFTADAGYRWSGGDYRIEGAGALVTADGLPLRFSDLIAGLGAPAVARAFDDFLELSFSEIGAELAYQSTNGAVTTTWSAFATADVKLKLFGQEFLGLHNTTVTVSGTQTGQLPATYAVTATGEIFILGITLPASLVLSSTTKSFAIGPLSFTLGDIITWMVNIVHPSWDYALPEPWNALNAIGFQNLTLLFDFEQETVTLDTGLTADFGFISLTAIRLTYHKRTAGSGAQGVVLAMKGTFLGLPIDVTTDDPDLKHDELGWDLINSKPVEVPGAGDQLFKLDYLGIGQHVAFRDTRDLHTIGEVMTALQDNLKPVADASGNPLTKLDGLVFAEDSGWLLGTKFTVLSTVTISAIFNDPQLYGLRIALAGEKAQSLAGLEFEILYKRISDTIGLYHIDLRLPDAIRQLEFGEVSVTIPEFVLDIYTNGNFKIDVGFPYKLDFARSFSVQVFPFVGFGGFYFGYLEGATSDRVPRVSDGSFKPVLEFGLGLSIGVGKTIEKGMLRAGATLTVEGIVEGVLAWFHPDDADRETALFYAIAGTVGIEGRVYGSIDFKVVKASVDITASAQVMLAIECYQPIEIALNVRVSARVSVKILFVTISCSFELDLSLEYTIGHASATPWTLADGRQPAGLLAARHVPGRSEYARLRTQRAQRLRRATRAPMLTLSLATRADPLLAGTDPIVVPLRFRPFFTQSDQASLASNPTPPGDTRTRSVAMLFTATDGTGPDTAFAQIAELSLRRVVAAALARKPTQQDRVSLFDLAVIKHQLDLGLHDPDFAYAALAAFFEAAGIVFDIDAAAPAGAVSATFFPMIPALTLTDTLTAPDGSHQQFVNVDYATDPRFMVDETYERLVDAYFRAFETQSETLVEQQAADAAREPAAAVHDGTRESMAQFVFRDFFLMVTQSMVEAAIAYLDAYPYQLSGTEPQSLATIAAAMAATDDPHDENPTPLSIASANLNRADILDGAAVSQATIVGARYQANNGEALTAIAARFGVIVTALAAQTNPDFGTANAALPGMVNPGLQLDLGDIVYTADNDSMTLALVAQLFAVPAKAIQGDPGNSNLNFALPLPAGTPVHVPGAHYVLQPTDTLASVAAAFATTLDTVVTRNAALTTLVRPLSVWAIPPFTHDHQSSDTLRSIAQAYAMPLAALLAGGYAAAPIIAGGATLTIPYRPDIAATELYAAMAAPATTGPIAASVSRFMMHGLRLPQITPPTFDTMQPFFNNLGQQLAVPGAVGETGYDYVLTLTGASDLAWVTLHNGPGNVGDGGSASYTYGPADVAELAIYAAAYTPAAVTVRQLPLMTYAPNRYPLRQVIHWQSPDGLAPVTGGATDGNGEPNIWSFPPALIERLQGGPAPDAGRATPAAEASALKFTIAVGHQDVPGRPPVFAPVETFAWGTLVEIGVRRVMAGSAAVTAVPNDYLVASSDPAARETLLRLWTHIADPDYDDHADIYVLSRADPAGQSARGVMSHALDAANTAVIKTNLSTTNTPAAFAAPLVARADEDPPTPSAIAASVAAPGAFLRLLWECVSVNSGGYYLNYTEAGTGADLPDDLFDTNGFGTVQLLVIFGSQRHAGATAAGQPPMLKLSNCAVLSDQLDLGNADLAVEAASYAVAPGKSLAQVREAMGFATLADFVAVNDAVKVLLREGLAITTGSGTTVRAGDSLAIVAARVGATPLAVANAIADDTDALIPGALCQYAQEQLRLVGTGAIGSVGIEVTRPNPDPEDADHAALTAAQKRDLMFNLLGVDLTGNAWFQPKAMTTDTGQAAGSANEWPAAGPIEPDEGDAASRAATWLYRKTVPYHAFAVATANAALPAPQLPPPDRNPYAGIASGSQIELGAHFQDNFGNRTGATGSGAVAIATGYRDLIHPLSAWPSVAASYLVRKVDPQPGGGVDKIGIEIDAGFRVATYVAGDGQSVAQARKRLAADQEKLRQIYYQVIQPDLQPSLATTLDSENAVAAPNALPKSVFVDIVNAALLFVGQQLALTQVTTAGSDGDTLTRLDSAWLITDPGAFPTANRELPVGQFFLLTGTDTTLTLPVTVLARAGQSLINIAASATQAMGTTVSELQVATQNAGIPLRADTSVVAPARTLPESGTQSLATLADRYRTTIAALADGNATATDVLRAGTPVTFQGLTYTIASGDSLAGLVTAFSQIATGPGLQTFEAAAAARGMSIGALAFANETATDILATDAPFTYPGPDGAITVRAAAGDSLYAVATKVAAQLPDGAAVSVESLVAANATVPGLFASGARLATGLLRVTTKAIADANARVPALFIDTARLTTAVYRVEPGDTLTTVVTAFAAIQPGYALNDFVTANAATGDLLPAGAQVLAGTRTTTPDPAQPLGEFADAAGVTLTELGRYNAAQPLAVTGVTKFLVPERTSAAALDFGALQPAAGQTLAQAATRFGTTAAQLTQTNAWMWRTLRPGATVTLNGGTVTATASDTFAGLWARSGGGETIDYAALASAIDAAQALRDNAVLVGPKAGAGPSDIAPVDLAAAWNVGVEDLLTANRSADAFLKAGVSVVFPGGAGPVTVDTRSGETINTLRAHAAATAGLETLERGAFFAALASTPGLIAAGAAFTVPPTIERIATTINRNFPSKLFRLEQAVMLARVNYLVTQATIAALAAVPDIRQSMADKLAPMATAAERYIDGDAFDAALRAAFGPTDAVDYLIAMTRRYAALPTELLDPSFADVTAAQAVSSQLPAHAEPEAGGDGARSLRAFAALFEAAFDGLVKVCVGGGGDAARPGQTPRQLWAADFSADGYGVRVAGDQPSFFARRPIATTLLSQNAVPMRYYVSGDPKPVAGAPIDIKQAELDVWAKQLLETVDLALSPDCAVTIRQHAPAALDALVAVKGRLAERLGGMLEQLIDNGHSGDVTTARRGYADRLKIRLGDAYKVDTVLQFPVTVTGGGPEAAGMQPPRLFGQPVNIPYVTAAAETIATLAAGLKVSQPYAVETLADMPGILNTGPDGATPVTVTYAPTGTTAQPSAGDTLTSLARALGIAGPRPAQALIDAVAVTPTGQGLFAPGVSLSALAVEHAPSAATTIEAGALALDVSVRQLAAAMQDTIGLFNPAVTSLSWHYGDGLTATVPVSASSTFGTLAQAFAEAGVQPAPDAVAVANYFRVLPTDLIAQGAPLAVVQLLPSYGFSATAVPLAAGGSVLTFFLDVASPARARKLFMNLDFPINQIEHAIRPVAADPDYQDSAWLSFVLPFNTAGGGTDTRIGMVEIPIPDAVYPDLPIVTGQSGDPSVLPAQPTLSDLKRWDYGFAFAYRAAAQDLIYAAVTINDVSGSAVRRRALALAEDSTPTNLLEALTQFAVSQPALVEDLQLLPFLGPANTGNPAVAAAAVLAEFADQVERLWGVLPPVQATGAGEDGPGRAHDYVLTTTRAREQEAYLDTLIITAQAAGETLWPGAVEVAASDGTWITLTPLTPQPTVEAVFAYPPRQIVADATLTYRLVFRDLDAIVAQSARAGLHVTRNASLSTQGATLPAFIYRTPVIGTYDDVTPLLMRTEPLLLASPPAPNGDLAHALSAFFQSLFDVDTVHWPTGATRLLSLHVAYRYDLAPGQPLAGADLTAQVPVLLHPEYAFALNPAQGSPDYAPTGETFVANVAEAVASWIAANLEPGQGGYLVFDLVVYAVQREIAPSPILEFTTVLWDLAPSQ